MADLHPPSARDGRRLTVLGQAAKAIHGEGDIAAALVWARKAAVALTGLPEAAICLLPRHGSPTWSASVGPVDFARVGDPRLSPALRSGLDRASPTVVPDVARAECD